MTLSVHLFDLPRSQVGVDLRGREIFVPEHFLHAPQVGPIVQHVRGETVSQRVRRDVLRQPRFDQVLAQLATNRSIRQPFPGPIDEERTRLGGTKRSGALAKIVLDGAKAVRTHCGQAFLLALSLHADGRIELV